MYRKLDEGTGDVLAYRLNGTLTQADVKEIKRDMESAIDSHGTVRVLCEMGDFSGAEPGAVWEDLKLTPRYARDVDRIAIVGDKRWHDGLARVTDALSIADAEFFEPDRRDEAWDWIRG
jgi:hypothetical protein